MVETGDDYLGRQSMYDYRLVSTVGFDQGDADAFAGISGVTAPLAPSVRTRWWT